MSNKPPIDEAKIIPTTARVTSSGEFARMIASFRGRHLVVDAPAYANGPGEAPTPPELMLSAIGSCALGMFDLVSARDNIPLKKCTVDLNSVFGSQTRNEEGVTVFEKIELKFLFEGISDEQAQMLVDTFQL